MASAVVQSFGPVIVSARPGEAAGLTGDCVVERGTRWRLSPLVWLPARPSNRDQQRCGRSQSDKCYPPHRTPKRRLDRFVNLAGGLRAHKVRPAGCVRAFAHFIRCKGLNIVRRGQTHFATTLLGCVDHALSQ